MVTTPQSLRSLTLDLPPSCIQFCPTRAQLFVVGTYHLHREEEEPKAATSAPSSTENRPEDDDDASANRPQKRSGSLLLFRLDDDDEITHLSTTPTDSAILDIQWTRHPAVLGELLAVATSTGLLALYRLAADGGALELSCSKTITDAATLVLSLTWHPVRPDVLGLTLSDGRLCLCESSSSGKGNSPPWSRDAVVRLTSIYQHELEAWTVAFTPTATSVFSGGDDIVLQCSELDHRSGVPVWQDRKTHGAGITAILPLSDHLIVTGSYDDHIRLLSGPRTGRRQVLAELHLGGGVWRLKLVHHDQKAPDTASRTTTPSSALSSDPTSFVLLASCMHAGSRIVQLRRIAAASPEWGFEVLAKFEEHQSMNYGSDSPPGAEASSTKKTIVSTSFYDKLLCLWRVDLGT